MSHEQQPDKPLLKTNNGFHPTEIAPHGEENADAPTVQAEMALAVPPTILGTPVLDAIQKIGLLLLPVIYVLGYYVWAYHAWRYNLGPLPAVQSQYLTAGLGPALIIEITAFCIHMTTRVLSATGSLFLPGASARKRSLGKAVFCLYCIACIIVVLTLVLNARHQLSTGVFCLAFGCCHIAALGTILICRLHDKTRSPSLHLEFSDWPTVSAIPILIGAMFVYVYCGFVFPNVPQEFGGGLPRIAQIEVSRESLSSPRLKALFLPEAAGSKEKIAVSKPLYIFFDGNQFLLVKPYARWTSNRAYEVEAGTVKGITWLDRDGFALQEPVRLSKVAPLHTARNKSK